MLGVPFESGQYDCNDIQRSDIDRCKDIVREKFAEWEDGGIVVDVLRASLLCPIGKVRIKLPCRSVYCKHLQCFDASTYLKTEETSSSLTKWRCPICEKPARFENLQVDSLFQVVLRKTSSWCTTVQFDKDGSWTAVTSNRYRTVEICEEEIDDEIQILREVVSVDSNGEQQNNLNLLSVFKKPVDEIQVIELDC